MLFWLTRASFSREAMARAGVVAVIEPAFWLGQPRTSPDTYLDYLSLITGFERFRGLTRNASSKAARAPAVTGVEVSGGRAPFGAPHKRRG